MNDNLIYTPSQVAEILQLKKTTIYDLIKRGEIIAKKIGKVYRIPRASISYVFTGLDQDIFEAQNEDLKSLDLVQSTIKQIRSEK